MRYLVDTHAFLWFIEGDLKLSAKSRAIIKDPQATKFISMASLWEIAIKINKNKSGVEKLSLTLPFDTLIKYIDVNGFKILPILFSHLDQLRKLTYQHGDPFDRLIISQVIVENLDIISIDKQFANYPINLIW